MDASAHRDRFAYILGRANTTNHGLDSRSVAASETRFAATVSNGFFGSPSDRPVARGVRRSMSSLSSCRTVPSRCSSTANTSIEPPGAKTRPEFSVDSATLTPGDGDARRHPRVSTHAQCPHRAALPISTNLLAVLCRGNQKVWRLPRRMDGGASHRPMPSMGRQRLGSSA